MNEEKINNLALFFKVFSDSTRLKIINALLKKELNVCELANIVEISQSAVSHQLQFLKISKLVKFKKIGKEVYYSLDDEHIKDIFMKGCEHIDEI